MDTITAKIIGTALGTYIKIGWGFIETLVKKASLIVYNANSDE